MYITFFLNRTRNRTRKTLKIQRRKRSYRPEFQIDKLISEMEVYSDLKTLFVDKYSVYIIVTDINAIYTLQKNLCGQLTLIAFNSRWKLFCDGYIADYNESITFSTYFDYSTIIKFIPCETNVDFPYLSDDTITSPDYAIKFLESSNFNLIIPEIRSGQTILLAIKFDHDAFLKFKLTLEYLSIGSRGSIKLNCQEKLSNCSNFNKNSTPMLKSLDNFKKNFVEYINFVYNNLNIQSNDIILIYGESNCGKTSLINYLINQYISEKKKSVYYLECDPGQTEFSPCGILSLVEIHQKTSNALGFKYLTNNGYSLSESEFIHSRIFGSITPSADYKNYLFNIVQLFSFYKNKPLKPLFINTCGWIEDTGLELLKEIISFTHPTHIIRIENIEKMFFFYCSSFDQFSHLTELPTIFDIKGSAKIWKASFLINKFINNNEIIFTHSYLRREINQILYLITNLYPKITNTPFFAIPPVKLLIKNIYLYFLNKPAITICSIYDIINVQWIILGRFDTNLEKIDFLMQDNSNNILHSMPATVDCLGCGLVRNVNPNDSSLMVTMPNVIDPKWINLIVLPVAISIPSGFLCEQFQYFKTNSLPYCYLTST